MGLFGPSKSELLEMFKTRDDGHVAREFNFRVNDAKKNQRDRYTIDMSVINQFTNLVKDLKMSEINRGIQMQKEQGPQKDWAIAGGIANGLLGGMAGVAVAVGTMQDNIESTIRHHENGGRYNFACCGSHHAGSVPEKGPRPPDAPLRRAGNNPSPCRTAPACRFPCGFPRRSCGDP